VLIIVCPQWAAVVVKPSGLLVTLYASFQRHHLLPTLLEKGAAVYQPYKEAHMPSCTRTPILPISTNLNAQNKAQPLPCVRRGHQQTANLASAPAAPILSADEQQLIHAHRKLTARDQALITTMAVEFAAKYPRRSAVALRLVSGGVQ
jgi:hypothetical protein